MFREFLGKGWHIGLGICLCFSFKLSAQTVMVNKADTLSILGNDFVSVIGGIWNDSAGAFYNEGTLFFTDSLINDGQNSMFHSSWQGMTEMRGQNQVIAGNSVTRFFDLKCTNSGIKRLAIHAEVEDSLILNHLEFATDQHALFCWNPDPGIVTRSSGFVSSLDTGYLWRNTASSNIYLFPTGSSVGVLRYRPVEIRPNAATATAFTARLANLDPSTDGFDRNMQDGSFCQINSLYYHRVRQPIGNLSGDISLYFDASADAPFDAMGHWQNVPRWENLNPVNAVPMVSPNLSSLTKSACTLWPMPPFVLANIIPLVNLIASNDSLCFNDSITFTAIPGGYPNYTFLNNGVDTLQSGPDSILAFSSMPAGLNHVSVISNTGPCQQQSDSLSVRVNNPFFMDAGRDTFLCYNQALNLGGNPTLSGGLPPYSYQWSPPAGLSTPNGPNPQVTLTDSVLFILVIGDGFGCNLSDTVRADVNPEIVANAGNDTLICFGTSITLGGNPSGGGGTGILNFAWTPNTFLNVSTSSNPIFTPDTNAHTYILQVTDQTLCNRSDTIRVSVDQLRPVSILASGPLSFCDHSTLVLSANPTSGNVLWNTGETTPSITITQSGAYTVQLSQYCGTTVSSVNNVNVWSTPIAAFHAQPTLQNIEKPIQFFDESTGNIVSWNWEFGDGGISSQVSPTYSYPQPGLYTVSLIVTSPEGCKDTATLSNYIEIFLKSTIFFPNAFTPNGDGLNDFFGPVGLHIEKLEMSIFDRWGKIVFYSQSINSLWNGQIEGMDAPEGVYTFRVNAILKEKGAIERAGTVTIIR